MLLPVNAPLRALVPSDGNLGTTWTSRSFNDSGWTQGTNGAGYDTGVVNPAEDLVTGLILGSAPIAYWRFEEPSGVTAANLGTLGSVANGTNLGGIALGQAGPQPPAYPGFPADNRAPAFDGVSGRVQVPDNAAFNFGTGPFSLMIWFSPSNAAVRSDLFTYKGPEGDFGVHLASQTPNTISVYHNGFIGTGGNVQDGQWHCFVLTRAGDGTATGYLNGAVIFTGSDAQTMTIAQDLLIGCNHAGSPEFPTYFYSGRLDEVALWNRSLSATEVVQQYQASLDPASMVSYADLIGCNLQAAMFAHNSSAFVRYQFVADNLARMQRLTLYLNYDDGFVAYLNGTLVARRNAPGTVLWNSAATAANPDSSVLQRESLNLTSSIGSLIAGTNVLAIQGLNLSATNADFLIRAELDADLTAGYGDTPRYFTVPSPGSLNGQGTADLGPVISGVGRTPAPPLVLTTNSSITVTARVQMAFAAVTNVTLSWRLMWGATNRLTMFDDGLNGDGAAGDGIYGATIPPGVATNGQMVRWFVQAWDDQGRASRWPLYVAATPSAEYEGAMYDDPSVFSQLQIWHFFIDPASGNFASIDTESGGRGCMSYAGEFYDNVYLELRGNTTAGYPKKSHRIEFNADHPLRHAVPGAEIVKTSLLSETADPAYLRTHLSFWLLDLMGVPSPFHYPVHCRLNGQFWGLWFHNDVIGAEQVGRLGYDPLGALYKAAGTVTPNYSSTGGFEKKTRLWEGREDYDALAAGINESRTLDQRKTFIFDNLNLPEIVNYLATVRWTQEGDDVWANMSLYRDTLGTKEWFIIPFDVNVSWGQLYCGDNSGAYSVVIATNDTYKSHPLYGGSQVQVGGSSAWNRIYDVIVAVPEARQMLLRRERTLAEKFVGPPGTSFSQGVMEQHIASMTNLMWTEMFLDRLKNGWPCSTVGSACGMYCWGQAWPTNADYGVPGLITQFIVPRRTHWWVTHSVTNSTKTIGLSNSFNAGLPTFQSTNAALALVSLEFNPASGNQAEEFVCLTNLSGQILDLSGWQVDGAVNFTFKPGTVVPSNGVIYVSPDVAAFRARTTSPKGGQGLFVVGPYKGQLSARGETLRLFDDTGRGVFTNTYMGNPSPAQQFLRITEIMYNPAPLAGNTNDAQQFEYLELKNISSSVSLDLRGVHFTNGIDFSFTGSAITSLAPGASVLVVKNTNTFEARYGAGFPVAGCYGGNLDNGGERLVLLDASNEQILDFSYNNRWYPLDRWSGLFAGGGERVRRAGRLGPAGQLACQRTGGRIAGRGGPGPGEPGPRLGQRGPDPGGQPAGAGHDRAPQSEPGGGGHRGLVSDRRFSNAAEVSDSGGDGGGGRMLCDR